jgi:hypothetical protein
MGCSFGCDRLKVKTGGHAPALLEVLSRSVKSEKSNCVGWADYADRSAEDILCKPEERFNRGEHREHGGIVEVAFGI